MNKTAIFIVISGVILAAISLQLASNSQAPVDSDALFGGQFEEGYEMAGYIVSFKGAKVNFCGMALTTPTSGISAAHCFVDGATQYAGVREFTTDKTKLVKINSYELSPDWDSISSQSDLANFTLSRAIEIDEYAELVEPRVGCTFRIVAYGRTEDDKSGISFDRPRKSSGYCVEDVSRLISLESDEGGVCVGDSGSPVFIEGTNKMIGVISAIKVVPGQKEPCFVGNTAVMAVPNDNSAVVDVEVLPAQGNYPLADSNLPDFVQNIDTDLMVKVVLVMVAALGAYLIYLFLSVVSNRN